MTLIRSAIVRITTLVIYIIAAYAAIQCTQSIDLQVAEFNVTMHNTTFCQEVHISFVNRKKNPISSYFFKLNLHMAE